MTNWKVQSKSSPEIYCLNSSFIMIKLRLYATQLYHVISSFNTQGVDTTCTFVNTCEPCADLEGGGGLDPPPRNLQSLISPILLEMKKNSSFSYLCTLTVIRQGWTPPGKLFLDLRIPTS